MSLDSFFSANYAEIRKWAREIASYDESLSDDLIHDAYLKLHGRRGDFSVIDPNAYVYVSMRNTYRSQIRHRSRMGESVDPTAEDKSNEILFQDPLRSLKVAERLFEICEFACSRRRSTISASLMILRYFLGYSSEDLSKVTNRSRSVIDTRLATFRRDIQLPAFTPPMYRSMSLGAGGSWLESLVFDEIKERVFRSPEGRCIPSSQLKRAYRWKSGRPDREDLSHLTSCRPCLEYANRLLKVDGLDRRHPLDIFSAERLLSALPATAFSAVFSIAGTVLHAA